MSVNLSGIAILNIRGSDYRFIISLIIENEAINLLQNEDLTIKKFIFIYIKMGKAILTLGNIDIEKKERFCHHKAPNFFGRCRYWKRPKKTSNFI